MDTEKSMTIGTEETIVAGSPADFMEVTHVVLRGTNREIGRRVAETARDQFGIEPIQGQDAAVQQASRHYMREHYPIHYQRMLGVADAYGLSVDDDRYDFSRLAFLFAFPGCSVAYIPPDRTQDGHSFLSRNYDFSIGTSSEMAGLPPQPGELPINSRPYVFETYPDEGYASVTLCVYDLLAGCIDGINSEGLTVALLADDESPTVYPAQPTLRLGVGLHETQILRFLLDTCANVDEAKQALLLTKQYRHVIPAHHIIADRFGNSFVWESSPLYSREYITSGDGDIQVVTNHMLYEGAKPLPDPSNDPGWTYNRLKLLSDAISNGHNGNQGISAGNLKEANACVSFSPALARAITGQDVEHSPGYRDLGRTIWHSLYDIDDRRVEVRFYLGDSEDGLNRYSDYKEFRLS